MNNKDWENSEWFESWLHLASGEQAKSNTN